MGHVVSCDLDSSHLYSNSTEVSSDIAEDYLAPEVLIEAGSLGTIMTASKWWTFGVLLYEMLIGLPPFYSEDVQERRHNILFKPLEMSKFVPESAQDLLAKLLIRNSKEPLGVNKTSRSKFILFFFF